ncbi:MAG: hypothetical protein HRU04_16700 [Oceanospirillaceae bacterium]|nr:hypothetical protein [Oceanospirillaceae bacterium]
MFETLKIGTGPHSLDIVRPMKPSDILAISLDEEEVLVKVTRGQSQLLDSLGVTGKDHG